MKPSRRMALVAAAVVLTLSACGSAAPSDSTAGTEPTTAVSDRSAPAVIELASSGSSAAAPKRSAGAEVATDAMSSMMAAPFTFTYAGDFPDLASEAPSWSFAPGAEVTPERVKELASAFGIEGEPTELSADQGGGWIVGSTDYTGPSITVSSSAMSDWWYNPGPTAVAPSVGCVGPEVLPAIEPLVDGVVADTVPADPALADPALVDPVLVDPALVDPGCEAPAPPTGVPTAEAAEAMARELFAAAGVDLSQYEFEVSADEWGAYVTAFLVLDGHRTPVTFGAGYGGDAVLQWASGVLAAPQAGPAYPLRDVAAGLQELQDQQTAWMGGVGAAAGVKDVAAEPAADDSIGADPAATDVVAPTDVAVDPMPVDPMPVDPCLATMDTPVAMPATDAAAPVDGSEAAPEVTTGLAPIDCIPMPMDPIEVVLTGVALDLTMVWAADGTIWLLPAYTFTSDDGAMFTVIAIDDAYLDTTAG